MEKKEEHSLMEFKWTMRFQRGCFDGFGRAKYTQTHLINHCVCVWFPSCTAVALIAFPRKLGLPRHTRTGREHQCHGPREIAHTYKTPACGGWKKCVLPALPGIKSTLLPPHIITTCKVTLSSTTKEMKVISLIFFSRIFF